VFAALLATVALTGGADASERSRQLRQQAYVATYNLDYDEATALFRQAIADDPNDAAAHRGAAAAAWLRIIFLRGTVTVDDYMGQLKSGEDIKLPAPPSDLATVYREHVQKAIALGEQAVARNKRDASALYDLGAAQGLAASYMASVEGRVFGAIKAARRAFNAHEKVLELDPSRKDANLVVGTYRYIISTMPAPVRWMAYLVGFAGGREKGLQMLAEAAAYPSDAQGDARFALVLFYNREGRFADALAILRGLERSYPGNRLLWLEEGATALRAGRPQEAERALDEGFERLRQDQRTRMPGEEGTWRYKRGSARVALRNIPAAREDLAAALALPDTLRWTRGRVHAELGKLADLAGDREGARREYRLALRIAEQTNDSPAEEGAKRLLKKGYR
jgi:tetratricopeptide (TPR) repeat protein